MLKITQSDAVAFRSLLNQLTYEFNSIGDEQLNEIMFYVFTGDEEYIKVFNEDQRETLDYLFEVCHDNSIYTIKDLLNYYMYKAAAVWNSCIPTTSELLIPPSNMVFEAGDIYKSSRGTFDMEGVMYYMHLLPAVTENMRSNTNKILVEKNDNDMARVECTCG